MNIFFVVVKITLHFYDAHSRSYAVTQESSSQVLIIAYADLFDYHPLSLHSCFPQQLSILSHLFTLQNVELLSIILLAYLTQRAINKIAKLCVSFVK